jgi:hypothetical protein
MHKWKTIILALLIFWIINIENYGAWAEAGNNLTNMMVQSYDLLEAGNVDETQKIYEQVLKRPGQSFGPEQPGGHYGQKGKV